jgi:hypothetical protein
MSEYDDEREAARRYRELPREEPPAALDAKIRAAALGAASKDSRRAVISHPAPLVAPTGRRQWYFPVAAAAVIVLSVAVTWQVEREQGDDGAMLAQNAPPPELRKEKKLLEEEVQKPAPLARKAEKPAAPERFAPEPGASAPSAQAPKAADEVKNQSPAESAAGTLPQSREDAYAQRENRARQERPSSGIAAIQGAQRQKQRDEAQVQPEATAKPAEEPPEKWLERIARLRQEGRHDEADKALAEFRRRYPDYRIPEAMLEKVEKK